MENNFDGTVNQELSADELRQRRMAYLKASNELLKQSMDKAMKIGGSDPIKQKNLETQFAKAMKENEEQAKSMLNATWEEVENTQYRNVDEWYINDYNDRLKKRGITDEQMREKGVATVTTSKTKKTDEVETVRRQRLGSEKNDEGIERLENEEELMKSTLANDDKSLENFNKKRAMKQYAFTESDGKKERRDPITKKIKALEEDIKESKAPKRVEDSTNVDKVRPVAIVNDTKEVTKPSVEKKTSAVEKKKQPKKRTETIKYDFDFSNIPSYIQYDVIPLPSNGQCYPIDSPLRCGRIPVAYLTAADENIIASPNVYRDGKLFDIILGRKILDKRIDPRELVSGDRDAIILWLRATSYGVDFPVSVTNPEDGKTYKITINLSDFDYYDFDLDGDNDGLFEYKTDSGDILKYKHFTADDEEELRNIISSEVIDRNKFDTLKYIRNINRLVNELDLDDNELKLVNEDLKELKIIIGSDVPDVDDESFANVITAQMFMHTVSINGNDDKEYIRNYIDNMRSKDAMRYRNTFNDIKPGVDLTFNVNIPESDGGGSFTSFLRITDTIFINF